MAEPKHLPPEALDEWLAAAAAELGLEPGRIDIGVVLDVARDVAHGVARPAAPLSTYLLGLAVGRAEARTAGAEADAADVADAELSLAESAAVLTALAERWAEQP